MMHFNRNHEPLTNDQLARVAPSIFAQHARGDVSERYKFIPTIDIVEGLRNEGYLPVAVADQRVRLDDNKGFGKHMVRFQHRDSLAAMRSVGDTVTQVLLVNSHDRSSAYQLHAALFRLACSNGMVVADSTFGKVSVRHTGNDLQGVIDATYEVVQALPELTARVEEFKAVELEPVEQLGLATAALGLRWETGKAPVSAQTLLRAQRGSDVGSDLWSTFNRVQENLLRGGQRDYAQRTESGKRFPKTRQVTGLDESTRLNKSLWELAEYLRVNRAA